MSHHRIIESETATFKIYGNGDLSRCAWTGRFTKKTQSFFGDRSLIVGGYWGNSSNAGVGYANANNSLDNSNNNIGSRLDFVHILGLDVITTVSPTLLMNFVSRRQESRTTFRLVPFKGNAGHKDQGRCAS